MAPRVRMSLSLVFMLALTGFSQSQNIRDILILKDKTVYNAAIKAIKDNTVIYSDPAGTVNDIELNKSEILAIILENGEVMTFSGNTVTVPAREQKRGDSTIDYEFGGEVSFMHASKNGEYNSLLTMEPYFVKYLSSFFFGPVLGLQVHWYRYYYYYYYSEQFYTGHTGEYVAGMLFGGLISDRKSGFLPYVSLGVCAVSYYNGSSTGVSIPIEFGLKQRIGGSTFLNYGFVYNYTNVEDNSLNTFGMHIGISFYRQSYSLSP